MVTILPDCVEIEVQEGESIVEALRRQGFRIRYRCRRGGCGACRAVLLEGEIAYISQVCATVIDGPSSKPGVRQCLPCRATPVTDLVIELSSHDRIVNVLSGMGSRSAGNTTTRRLTTKSTNDWEQPWP
jgi:ferredoxin